MSSPSWLSITLYSLSSFLLTLLVLLYAYATRIRFYPVVVFLFTSKFALVSVVNSGVVLGFLFALACVRLFLGKLREAETEALWEHLRYTVLESAFALSTFREELNIRVALLFSVMLFTKLFQMLLAGRVEHIEQQSNPQLARSVHVRLFALIAFLTVCNLAMLAGSVWHLKSFGPSVYFLFAFEHALSLVNVTSLVAKYAICLYDLHVVEGRWANKSAIEMYCALTSEALQFGFCLAYTCLIWTHFGVPMHTMRPLYFTFRTLVDRITHFVRYRRILHTLNERFPTATAEELANTDGVCIICREDMYMTEADNHGLGLPKKLQCNHLFHSYCLQTWLERQFSCPTCRRPIPLHMPHAAAAAAAVPVPAGVPVDVAAPVAAAAVVAEDVDGGHHHHDDDEEEDEDDEDYDDEDDDDEEEEALEPHLFVADQVLDEMEREFKNSPTSAATLKASLLRRQREQDAADAALLKMSPLFASSAAAASPPSSPAAAAANADRIDQRRELLELELRVFEAQSNVAKQVYDLSRTLLHQQQHSQ